LVTALKTRPGLGEILTTWLIFGIQSFGGGSSTFYLIHQACIERGWLDEDEFVRAWALAQMAPGINLLKLTVMVGYQLRGWPGLVLASAGLLLPSAVLTVLMTAGFATIRTVPLIQAVMKGVLPAAIGLSLANAVQMAQPLFSRAQQEGRARLGAHLFILLGAALLLALTSISPIVILVLAGAAAALLLALISTSALPQPEEKGVR
jgi:chromate transporter